eukprot:TRINITY_DN19705_c0_g1_i1.p1 TRINITY_DN19705_c0_g1~~TRINITY_DN19705_c0_g1_i1.p1  ORF type:complete len:271 (-),score=-22.53 TRINITY_DN19705_c0_g1_i1:390-1202(-)
MAFVFLQKIGFFHQFLQQINWLRTGSTDQTSTLTLYVKNNQDFKQITKILSTIHFYCTYFQIPNSVIPKHFQIYIHALLLYILQIQIEILRINTQCNTKNDYYIYICIHYKPCICKINVQILNAYKLDFQIKKVQQIFYNPRFCNQAQNYFLLSRNHSSKLLQLIKFLSIVLKQFTKKLLLTIFIVDTLQFKLQYFKILGESQFQFFSKRNLAYQKLDNQKNSIFCKNLEVLREQFTKNLLCRDIQNISDYQSPKKKNESVFHKLGFSIP